MARGKIKYKGAVKGGNSKKNIKKEPIKLRKTYSLFRNDYQKRMKRKFEHFDNKNNKQSKNEGKLRVSENEDELDCEEENGTLKQLQKTFSSSSNKKSMAIDSDSSEEELELDKVENSNETTLKIKEKLFENNIKNQQDRCDSKLEVEESNILHEDGIELENLTEETDILEDPFVKHLFYELPEELLNSLQKSDPLINNYTLNWPKLGKLLIQIPYYAEQETRTVTKFKLEGDKTFASCGTIPTKIDHKTVKPEDMYIKTKIISNLGKANPFHENGTIFSPLQRELFSIINNYQDLYYNEKTFSNSEEIRYIYCLHVVNHILKTRTKIIQHNARLSKKDQVPEEFRDQGLVRPKILIVLPFKDAAYKTVNMIIDILLSENKGNVMNKQRFVDEYKGNGIVMPKKNPKPEDYELTFTGNTSDDFRIGITFTKKCLKLYANFYSSDIIIASPLGLRTIIGAEGESDRDYDFLASIELLIFDQTELFLMQNWDHLNHLMAHLHLQPKDLHGTDFARVRTWYLNGWAKYYRQTLIFSSIILPEINSIFNKKCFNYRGKVKIANSIEFGSMGQVFAQLPHIFRKFNVSNISHCVEQRFELFINKILPQQKESLMKQTLIYVSNYFDYVRLRNYFKKEDISFVQICEYSKEGKIARARDMFYHGAVHFMLYTERYHFFNRIRVKGIRHLIFYQLPSFPHFYYEMTNLMQEYNMNKNIGNLSNMTITVLYSKYDIHQLAGIVGSDKATKMLQSERNVHMMLTGTD